MTAQIPKQAEADIQIIPTAVEGGMVIYEVWWRGNAWFCAENIRAKIGQPLLIKGNKWFSQERVPPGVRLTRHAYLEGERRDG